MATKKSGGSTKNNRDSQPKYLGTKLHDGQKVFAPEYLELLQKYFVSKNAKAARGATGAETLYKVKAGDTLSTISQAILGDKLRYKEIEYRNNLPNPNLIQIGQKLVIPKT